MSHGIVESVITLISLSQDNFNLDLIALVSLIVLFRFMAFVALYLRARSKE